jgi:hypothetical protein
MGIQNDPPKNIGELIDHIERIREELLSIQRSMEKMEPAKPLTTESNNSNSRVKGSSTSL